MGKSSVSALRSVIAMQFGSLSSRDCDVPYKLLIAMDKICKPWENYQFLQACHSMGLTVLSLAMDGQAEDLG